MKGKFTFREERFVEIYAGNATKSAIEAGFSKKTAYSAGQRLLKKVEIRQAIEARTAKQTKKHIATREERQQFWTEMYADKTVSPSDRLRAAELLGKSEADFVDRVQHSGHMAVKPSPEMEAMFNSWRKAHHK